MTSVIVADDHPIIVSGLQSVLRDSEFRIEAVVADGRKVVETVDSLRPDILVLDVSMPGRDGIEVLAELRARRAPCRVVLLTAGVSDESLLRALELGVEGIVLKEDAASSLVRALDKVRGGGRAIDAGLLQRAVDLRMGGTQASSLSSLSPRELMVARRVAEGQRNREIADALAISEGTVKVHLHKIYEKLGITNRTELALLARDALPN